MAAPYAARINSILRHTGQQIAVMTTPTGKQLQEKLDSVNIINYVFRNNYLTLRGPGGVGVGFFSVPKFYRENNADFNKKF